MTDWLLVDNAVLLVALCNGLLICKYWGLMGIGEGLVDLCCECLLGID